MESKSQRCPFVPELQEPDHKYVVQCKHTTKKGRKLSVNYVREFLGTLIDHDVTAGMFFTNACFTKSAAKLIEKHSSRLYKIDFEALKNWMKKYLKITIPVNGYCHS